MNAILRVFFTAFLCSISTILFAQSVDINTAKAIAEHHLASISRPSLKSTASKGKNFQFALVKATVENNDTLYYILNDTINKGFVIVSADKRTWPILAYSTEGSFDEKNQPEAFIAWMNNRKKEIESIKKNNLQPDNATIASWQNLSLKSSAIETTSVEPLIQTQWDQGCYYNTMCPADAAGPCGHTVTGCTITAMAQIMKYWNYPTKGSGSHSYDDPTYGNLSADFGSTTYQWSQMPNSVTSPNDAVATLMYHCGVSLDAGYGTGATTAWDPRNELVQYFNYSSKAVLINRSGFTTSDWIQILKSELDLQHPIYYTGSSSVGHSFICDGYQDEEYFHFNWGWGGSSDGYFYIGNLNPGWFNFNENQFALFNLVPGNLPDGYKGFFLSSNALDIATKGGTTSVDVCSSTNWTASSDQSWLSLSTNTGVSGKTTLILTATENQTESDRSATITISAAGFSDQTITVNQLTKLNVTPGGLYNLISKNATAISKLTLAGTIDARDFKTMRDAMPALTDLDLSDVTIGAYTGTEGTLNESRAYPANEIPVNAFYIIPCRGQNLLESFILPATTTSIQYQAFGYSKYLTTINIPALVTNITVGAFNLCNTVINVDSNNPNYSSIDGVLFNKNRTTIIHCPTSKTGNYTIPSSVTTIGESAFLSCIKLTTVTIPSSVTSIRNYAFNDCGGLTTVFIPSSVTSIERWVFYDSSILINVDANNPNYSSIDGILFNKTQTKLIQCPNSKRGNYTIPSTVTSIGNSAFYGCYGLLTVTIPSSVTSIEADAFNRCSGLTLVSIPSSVTSIGLGAFAGCIRLITVTIPSSVTAISDYAFGGCSGLFTITIPPSVTAVGEQAFCGCSGLTNVTIPSSVISIGSDAFFACRKLTNLTIPSSVKAIGTSAFASCNSLRSIFAYPIIPVDLNSSLGVFSDINKFTCTLYVPYGSKAAYQMAAQWKDFINIVEMPNQAPVANAGTNQTTREGKPVTLNGAGSTDAEGKSLTYKWEAPAGITLNDTTISKPAFTAPNVIDSTNFTFGLVVNDGDLDSPADEVTVTVTPNKVPIANAGTDQAVSENNLFTLNGTASSDPDNDELSYFWIAPEGIALSSNIASKPTFTAPEVRTDTSYTFSLIVSDGLLNSTAYPIVITVKNVDKAPYLKNPIMDISADKRDPDQTIDLKTVFADDDLGDVLSYSVTSNTNSEVVTAKIAGSNLTVGFSSQNTGTSEIVITANSNGKEVTSKFNVKVKIPTGIDLLVFDQNFSLYPNPTTGKLKLVFNKIPVNGITVTITDSNGKNCLKKLIREKEVWIDLSGNVPGIYFIKTDQKNSKTPKVILK